MEGRQTLPVIVGLSRPSVQLWDSRSERGVRIDHNKEQSSVAIFHERQEMLGAQS
jgi:hypothetical protein